jgi:hypothetical protein
VFWDRERDNFEPGPWFKGRIYPDRSDLSPDGRHLLYFAMGGVAWAIPKTGGTWTAISCVPSLMAVALWGQGDTWGGGGMFTSNRSFWLEADRNTFKIGDTSGLRRDSKRPAVSRMKRDGWELKSKLDHGETFEKALPGGWILRKVARYPKPDKYELQNLEGECLLDLSGWEWADWDRRRVVWAEKGCIKAAKLGRERLNRVRILCDFNEIAEPDPTRPK